MVFGTEVLAIIICAVGVVGWQTVISRTTQSYVDKLKWEKWSGFNRARSELARKAFVDDHRMSTDSDPEDFRPGETFAGFRILREIGRGGMGSVYLAEDERLCRRAALKVILPEFGAKRGSADASKPRPELRLRSSTQTWSRSCRPGRPRAGSIWRCASSKVKI